MTVKKLALGVFGVLFLVFWVTLLTGKTWSGDPIWTSDTPPLQVIPNMDHDSKVRPQSGSTVFSDMRSERPVVAHTVPTTGLGYTIEDVAEAEESLVNPLQPTPEILARGENRYGVMCMACHGESGAGDGTIGARSATMKPPNLMANSTGYSDARLFHIISKGQNIMPGYADKLNESDRWAVVHYVRQLQAGN